MFFLYFVVGGRTMWYERFFFHARNQKRLSLETVGFIKKPWQLGTPDENLPGILKGLFMNDVT